MGLINIFASHPDSHYWTFSTHILFVLTTMSPTAVYSQSESLPTVSLPTPVHSKGPALVIGSLSTAEDGKYQALISELEPSRQVDKQLLDRIVDEGESGLPVTLCHRTLIPMTLQLRLSLLLHMPLSMLPFRNQTTTH